MTWHAFEVVRSADRVNHAWEPTQRESTRILGEGWAAQVEHEGPCSREGCISIPCSPIFGRPYRAVIDAPVRVEARGDVPVQAFDNLLRALA